MKCLFAFALPLLLLSGCGGDGDMEGVVVQDVVPVTGTATYQGKPLEDYAVYFGNLQDRPAMGMIDAEGRFTLGTNSSDDGAPPGTHTVWFSYSPVVEVEPGREQTDKPLPPPKVKLPPKFTRKKTSDIKVEVPEDGLTDYKLELE